ncbi:MAG TPA: MauE/DoxX family redox-associated membrane protein [Myxococcota bacterium]|nr:MauE/DoxX family redox-associated membrane protein [Myxococcota bacterium]HQK51722.1 MauE/DoxX family redox-associated membrane protein [Myxococcota bacterium]
MTAILEWKGHRWIGLLARVYLALVFLVACWHKIRHPDAFAVDVATYQILPLALVNLVAITLPWVELGAGVMLLVGFRARAGALMVTGMMLVFLAALIVALARGLDMSCGCFASQGAAEDPISYRTVLRDLGWLALAVYVLLLDRQPLGLDSWIAGRRRS